MAVLHLGNACNRSPDGTRDFLKSGLRLARKPKSQAVCLALLGKKATFAGTDGLSCSVRHRNWAGEPSAMRTVCAQQASVPGYVLTVQTSAMGRCHCQGVITTDDLEMRGPCGFSSSRFEGFNHSQMKASL